MRNIQIDGHLKADAELKRSKNGNEYLYFEVANKTYKRGEYETTWYTVFSYDDALRKRASGFKKGSYVFVQGAYDVDVVIKEGKTYFNHSVQACMVELLNSGSKKGENTGRNNGSASTGTINVAGTEGINIPVVPPANPTPVAGPVQENIVPNKVTASTFNEPSIPLPNDNSQVVGSVPSASDADDLPF